MSGCVLLEERFDRHYDQPRLQTRLQFCQTSRIPLEGRVTGNFLLSLDRPESHIGPKASCKSRFTSYASRFSMAQKQSRVNFESQVGLSLRLFVTNLLSLLRLHVRASVVILKSAHFYMFSTFASVACICRESLNHDHLRPTKYLQHTFFARSKFILSL